MSATRRLVAESHEDGTGRVLSLPLVRWQIYDQPPPKPSSEELADEIRLLLADAQIEPQPLITHASDGQIRLSWPRDLERLAEGVVLALAPEIRRLRRARRSAKGCAPRPQKPTVKEPPKRKRKDIQRRLIEVEQQRDGSWRVSPSDAAEAVGERFVIPQCILGEIRNHALELAQGGGLESVGRIVFVDGRAREYVRLRNLLADAGVPDRMRLGSSWRRVPGETSVILHSHPCGPAEPSHGDLRWAARYPSYRGTFGTYSVPLGRLGIWRLDGSGYREAEWSLVS